MQRDFLAGSTFSMADIDLLALLHFAGWSIKTEPDASLEHLTAWRQRTGSIGAVRLIRHAHRCDLLGRKPAGRLQRYISGRGPSGQLHWKALEYLVSR